MLSKAIYQRTLSRNLLVQPMQRHIRVNNEKQYVEPVDGLEDLIKYMD